MSPKPPAAASEDTRPLDEIMQERGYTVVKGSGRERGVGGGGVNASEHGACPPRGHEALVEEWFTVCANDGAFDDRDDWVRVAMATKAAAGGDPVLMDRYFDAWDAWSDPEPSAGYNRKVWDGLKPDSAGFGTLVWLAGQRVGEQAAQDWYARAVQARVSQSHSVEQMRTEFDVVEGENEDAGGGSAGGGSNVVTLSGAKVSSAVPAWVSALNEDWAILSVGDRIRIVDRKATAANRKLASLSPFDFDIAVADLPDVVVGVNKNGSPKLMAQGKAWRANPHRSFYTGADVFAGGPGDPPVSAGGSGEFNLWMGWDVDAGRLASARGMSVDELKAPGRCGRILEHLLTVWCDGDLLGYEYLLGWLARLVQTPGALGSTCLVVHGEQGCGKSVVADMFLRVLRGHSLPLTSPEALSGRFTGHLLGKLFCVAEEAVFVRNPQHWARMKALITNGSIDYEFKGLTPFAGANRLSLMILSNDEHVVNLSRRDRRYVVYRCSDRRVGSHGYFDRLLSELSSPEWFLEYLRRLRLGGFRVGSVPDLLGRRLQQVQTATSVGTDPVGAWWFDVLKRGDIGAPGWDAGAIVVSTSGLQDMVRDFLVAQRVSYMPNIPMVLGARLKELLGGVLVKRKSQSGGVRVYEYELPSLEDCRRAWSNAHGVKFDDVV